MELAPDSRYQFDHLRISGRVALQVAAVVGTRDGGAFETSVVVVSVYDAEARIQEVDVYDLDQLAEARARFDELVNSAKEEGSAPQAVPNPLEIPPNAATRMRDRIREAYLVRDWAAVRALAGPDFSYEDRGKRALLNGDVEMWVNSMQYWGPGTRAESELLGTVGERIALHQMLWAGGPDGTPFEVDRIRLIEVDENGLLRAVAMFDLDDRGPVFVEAYDRFIAGEFAAAGGQPVLGTAVRALMSKDWTALRDSVASDIAYHDRRTLGLGVLDADTWVESLQTLAKLAADVNFELFRTLVWNAYGFIAASRQTGKIADGGQFENVFIALWFTDGDGIRCVELFDIDDGDAAMARFEELCAAS